MLRERKKKPWIERKIFAKITSDKGLLPRIHKEILNLTIRKQSNLKMGKRPEQIPNQRRYTDGE